MKSLAGEEVDLAKYQGKVVMIVNVASKCGYTGQYEQLQALHEKYAARGLAILGFPCNQFLGQEPGSAEEIQAFCRKNYGVTFDLFTKVNVNGENACSLYKFLTSLDTKPKGAGKIGWNFEKFLIDRNGMVVARFGSSTKPDAPEIVAIIEQELARTPAVKRDYQEVVPIAESDNAHLLRQPRGSADPSQPVHADSPTAKLPWTTAASGSME
ncbi:MAG: glutathione peroxidase [Planctomycetes bacterium]|nr:glutathione peroxidase [Planctomycetota bacterium]